jgi:flagellar motor switch protein FliG
MTYERVDRIRRAAILVASLEEALAEAVLGELPPLEATRVLAELERLDEIDPDEQQDVLEEFRRAARRSDAGAAVEFTYSAPVAAATTTAQKRMTAASSGDGDAEIHAMAEVLSQEHPQIIAAALSRLDADRAAAVFAALPAELHAEVLDRVSRLAPADEEAVQEVQSHLERQVGERRAHLERAAAGAELARKLVAHTAPAQRIVLLERLSVKQSGGGLGFRYPEVARGVRPDSSADFGMTKTSNGNLSRYQESPFPVRTPAAPAASVNDPTAPPRETDAVLADLSPALLALGDEALVAALRSVDEQTGQRALAASSEQLIKRITRQLPRRQARSLKRLLRNFGPTRLADLRRAQLDLLRAAERFAEPKAA